MSEEYSYRDALKILIDYSKSEGFEKIDINYNRISRIIWDSATLNKGIAIKIQGTYRSEDRTYIFLHELGHHELRKDWDSFSKRFPILAHAEYMSVFKNEKKYIRRKSYKVCSLEEEFAAWEAGLKLAEKFNIPINFRKWNNLKIGCLKKYIKYYSEQL